MNQKDLLRQFATLSERERDILRLVCDPTDLSYEAIGERLGIAKTTVQTHISHIFGKLGLYALPENERLKYTRDDICPVFLRAELPPPRQERLVASEPARGTRASTVDEDETAMAPSGKTESYRIRWLLLAILLVMLLATCLLAANLMGFAGLGDRETATPIVQTVEVTRVVKETVEFIREVEVTREIETEVTRLVSQTPGTIQPTPETTIQKEVGGLTATPPPTEATPSFTSEIQPTNTAQVPATPTMGTTVLFEDDFDAGLSSDWQVVSGSPVIVNDALTTYDEAWLIVGDSSWTDYTVEFDVISPYGESIVGVRFQDLDNMTAFFWKFTNSNWQVAENGNWTSVPNTASGNIGYPPSHMRITVEGDKFTATIGNRRLSSFFDSTFRQGKLALKIGAAATIDNFKVTLPSR